MARRGQGGAALQLQTASRPEPIELSESNAINKK